MTNIFEDQGKSAKVFGIKRTWALNILGNWNGFINGEQRIKSQKFEGSWEHVPPGKGSLVTRLSSETMVAPSLNAGGIAKSQWLNLHYSQVTTDKSNLSLQNSTDQKSPSRQINHGNTHQN